MICYPFDYQKYKQVKKVVKRIVICFTISYLFSTRIVWKVTDWKKYRTFNELTFKFSIVDIMLHCCIKIFYSASIIKKVIDIKQSFKDFENLNENMLISTARWIYKMPFFVHNFINTTHLRSIIVNSSQSELDLTLTKLNKSKIDKNNISVTDGWTNGRTDRRFEG